ncbi:MAG: hypothetical protein AMXMBFR81_00140 [Chthonomonas sp.]
MTTLALLALGVLNAPVLEAVPPARLERLSKGANVCRWFRYPVNDNVGHYMAYISDPEMKAMRAMGLRHVRLTIHPQHVFYARDGEIVESKWMHIMNAVDRFIEHDLAVLFDIHNEDQAAIQTKEWQDSFVKFWDTASKRLAAKNPEMLFLEFVNEPVFDGREAEWFALQERLHAVIRKNAPNHTLMATGPNWGGIDGLRKLTPLKDGNVVYSFHCYEPFPFTHQGATWSSENVKPLRNVPYPSSPEAVAPLLAGLPQDARETLAWYGEERWGRKKLSERFGQAIEWGKKHGVPLYCGEFGVFPPYAPEASRAAWFKDFGEILAENKVGWSVWGWDEGFGLNRQMKDGKPVWDAVVARSLGLKAP